MVHGGRGVTVVVERTPELGVAAPIGDGCTVVFQHLPDAELHNRASMIFAISANVVPES
jgi:hypothetical protein